MNKEYRMLNDNTIEVVDEKGIETNIGEFENSDIKNILLSENKIEIVENLEEKLKKEKIEIEKGIIVSNCMLIFSTILLFLTSSVGFISGAISNPDYYIIAGIIRGTYWLGSAIIPIAGTKIYFNVVKIILNKKIKKTETKLFKVNNMKKEYEKELQLEIDKTVTNNLEPLVKVSLEKETNVIKTQIIEQFKELTEENIKQRGKVKVRKR